MDEKPVTADVVVACLFAGVGAWAAEVHVESGPTYASELFGPGHGSIKEYPTDKMPMVTLTIPGNAADDPFTATSETDATTKGTAHGGSALVTFTVHGATFDANIGEIRWDSNVVRDDVTSVGGDGDGDGYDYEVAPGNVVSIEEGGRKGDNFITLRIEAAADEGDDGRNVENFHRFRFAIPTLAGLDGLAGANPRDPNKRVWLTASSRVLGGAFTDGVLGPNLGQRYGYIIPNPIINAVDSLTLTVEGQDERIVAISDDAKAKLTAFKSVKAMTGDAGAYALISTITIDAEQIEKEGTPEDPGGDMYFIRGSVDADRDTGDDGDDVIYKAKTDRVPDKPWMIYDLDGELVDEGLRGTFAVTATGSRGLFNEGDVLFVDYDGNKKPGAGEVIEWSDDAPGMAEGDALSIDAIDKTGSFHVYYMPGGKGSINHGASIKVVANVDYSLPSALDEAPKDSTTTLNFDGVEMPVHAYAIPHSTNGNGDKGNVRVRCETPAPGPAMSCRVFIECWDDMGMRGFGEAPMIGVDNVAVWDGAAIEGVVGMDEPMSRHSCRILSTGAVTVQQLTRDGNSGTLVNNTYVGGS